LVSRVRPMVFPGVLEANLPRIGSHDTGQISGEQGKRAACYALRATRCGLRATRGFVFFRGLGGF